MSTNSINIQKKLKFHGIEINSENLALFCFLLISLIINLFPVQYGYFRDELYYIALSKNLAWGYVDVPPLMPFCMAIMRFFFGESLFAIHLLPAIFGVVVLILTREIVKKLGGKLLAQVITLSCLVLSPMFVIVYSWITYMSFDGLFWALCLYYLTRLLTSNDKKYWLYIGVFSGLGLMSRFSILWLDAGIVVAILFTKERKHLISWQFWAAVMIATLIVSPYLIWIVKTNFLTIEYFVKYAQQTTRLSTWGFIIEQIKSTNPLAVPIWLAGLCYFLFQDKGKTFRIFGLTYLVIFALCIIPHAKTYMLWPFYPVLFAGGAVFIEDIGYQYRVFNVTARLYVPLIAAFGLFLLPVVRPVLQVEQLIKYGNYTHLFKPGSTSSTDGHVKQGLLPQQLSDRFGWEEMAAAVAKVYHALPEAQKAKTAIVAGNYGAASALYFYSKKYNIPIPISQHDQYYLWGYRRANTDWNFIMVNNGSFADLQKNFRIVVKVGQIDNKYAIPDENKPIFLCSGLKMPIAEVWRKGKNMSM